MCWHTPEILPCKHCKISLQPVQRLPQYRLLLEDYLKQIGQDSPDFDHTTEALNIVSSVADHANNTVKKGVS